MAYFGMWSKGMWSKFSAECSAGQRLRCAWIRGSATVRSGSRARYEQTATEVVAKAVPDGYTLVMAGSGLFGINPAIFPKLPFDTVPGVLGQVKAGKLRALAVAASQRSPFLSDVPTVAEQGIADFAAVGCIGIAAPVKTPATILDQLNAEVRKMLAAPEVKERMASLAFVPVGDSRAQFGAFMRAEITRWTKVVKESGAKVD